MYDLIVKNGTILNYNQDPVVADIAISKGKIDKIGKMDKNYNPLRWTRMARSSWH